jgi:hypothetical protein
MKKKIASDSLKVSIVDFNSASGNRFDELSKYLKIGEHRKFYNKGFSDYLQSQNYLDFWTTTN